MCLTCHKYELNEMKNPSTDGRGQLALRTERHVLSMKKCTLLPDCYFHFPEIVLLEDGTK